MPKTIAFFVRNLDAEKPPFASARYGRSSQEYLLAIKRAGAHVYFVTDNQSYKGNGHFSQSWTIDAVCDIRDFRATGEITADLVFEKGGFEGTDVKIVTDPRLYPITRDKAQIYRVFSQYQPMTTICHNDAEFQIALAQTPGEIIVVKSPEGSGGKRVYITKRQAAVMPAHEVFPILVQEFVDMSDGIPGIVEGAHDLRILMTGGVMIGGALRLPAKGSFLANVSQGGSLELLSPEVIPPEARKLALNIDSALGDYPRYYSIDLAKGKQGWYLIEINDKPGLFPAGTGPLAQPFMDKIAQYLVSQAEE